MAHNEIILINSLLLLLYCLLDIDILFFKFGYNPIIFITIYIFGFGNKENIIFGNSNR